MLIFYLHKSCLFRVIHKVRTFRFRNFRPLCRCTYTYAFILHPFPSSTSVRLLFFKEDMTHLSQIYFVNHCQSKNHTSHITLQNKETTAQSYQKMSKQNAKKSPGIDFALFNCTREIGTDNFGYLNSALYFISIL